MDSFTLAQVYLKLRKFSVLYLIFGIIGFANISKNDWDNGYNVMNSLTSVLKIFIFVDFQFIAQILGVGKGFMKSIALYSALVVLAVIMIFSIILAAQVKDVIVMIGTILIILLSIPLQLIVWNIIGREDRGEVDALIEEENMETPIATASYV
jgi:hypothetical protein